MRVARVAQQVLVATGVIQADDRTTDQRGATEREEVVGRVVEQDRDMTGTVSGQPLEEQRREPARLREVLGVRPALVAELDRDAVAVFGGIAAQQGGGVRRHERSLTGRGNRTRSQT